MWPRSASDSSVSTDRTGDHTKELESKNAMKTKVRFWLQVRMVDAVVHAETPRRYVVTLDGESVQVSKHSATPLPEEFAPAIDKKDNAHGVVGYAVYSPTCLSGKTLDRLQWDRGNLFTDK